MDWSAEQIVAGYGGQQQVEQVFRGLKDGEWLGWGPMYHWTDSKIRILAFYCMLGISLLQYIHNEAETIWPGLSSEQLLLELGQIQQFLLLYPPQGKKGPQRTAPCFPSRPFRSRLWPMRWVWNSSVVPNVGNTRSQPESAISSVGYPTLSTLRSKLRLGNPASTAISNKTTGRAGVLCTAQPDLWRV
jgi:hypothetical protein